MKALKLLLLIFAITTKEMWASAERRNYDNYHVYRVNAASNDPNSLKALQDLAHTFSCWGWTDRQTADILVAPRLISSFDALVKLHRLNAQPWITNVQELIDNERPLTRSGSGSFDWTDYQTLDEINEWLYSLADSYPDVVEIVEGGVSYEGRSILGAHVSFSAQNTNNTIFLEGNIHAREWITSAVLTYILNEILTGTDPAVRAVAETHDWYIFPVTNPDGFVYTHTEDRLWRKTRTPYGTCNGADPNRNWDYHWNEGGTSNNPCDETYRGPEAFSENSTKSLSKFIGGISSQLTGYIAFHSYSQLILLPYGYSSDHLDNYDDVYSVGLKAAESLAQRYGTQYQVGNIVDLLYVASGGSMDWVKGNFQTPLAYTYELRDTGLYGFVLPADQIIPTSEETLDSLITYIEGFS